MAGRLIGPGVPKIDPVYDFERVDLGDPKANRAANHRRAQEHDAAMRAAGHEPAWWWLSFTNDRDNTFEGVAIVQGYNFIGAAQQAHAQKCNPGGEIQAHLLEEWVPRSKWRNRLLTHKQAERINTEMWRRALVAEVFLAWVARDFYGVGLAESPAEVISDDARAVILKDLDPGV